MAVEIDSVSARENYLGLTAKEIFSIIAEGLSRRESTYFQDQTRKDIHDDPTGQYRDLQKKKTCAEFGMGPSLSPKEEARLTSKLRFPLGKDEYFRELDEREQLAQLALGPDLTDEEMTDLISKLEFPEDEDEAYRLLAKQELLSHHGKAQVLTLESRQLLMEKRTIG